MSYQSYLQQQAAQGGLAGREAQALLNAGMYNQGGVLKNSIANVLTNGIGGITGNYGLAQGLGYNERGHIESGGYGYGAQGLSKLNDKYMSQYSQQNPSVLGAYTGGGTNYNQATVNQLDSGISALEAAKGRLPRQLDIARANVNDQYNTTINQLDSARNAAENQYSQSSTGNMQSLRTNKNNILDQQSQGLRGLLRTLGMYGAVGSDATLASEAVANEATRQRSGAGSVFAQNQRALDTNWGQFQNEDKNRRKDAQDWRKRQLDTAEQKSAQTKQDLLSRLAELRGQRAATIGGSYSGAAQPYLDQANALSSRIDQLGRFKPTFDGKTPVYQAPSLDSYSLGAGPTIDAGGQPQVATPTLNALLGLGQRDDDDRVVF